MRGHREVRTCKLMALSEELRPWVPILGSAKGELGLVVMSGDAGRDLSILSNGGGFGFWGIGGDKVGVSPVSLDPELGGESRRPSILEIVGPVITIEGSDLLEGGGLICVPSEGSLSEIGDEISTAPLESGGADFTLSGSGLYSGIRVLSRMSYTL